MMTVAPAATKITIPQVSSMKGVPRGTQLRIPRSVQLQLARSLTFGVIGEDSQLYPSSKWQTEKQGQFATRSSNVAPKGKPDFVITSLDTRKHNPQTKNLFHIKRINTKPVCSVTAWDDKAQTAGDATDLTSVYNVSYQGDAPQEPTQRNLYKLKTPKPIESIVPVNMTGNKIDIRAEMMLPACDVTNMPSAHNPHTYLLRKRKVPPPCKSPRRRNVNPTASGIVYPSLEKPRMTSYNNGDIQTGDLPFETHGPPASNNPDDYPDRICISSLSGKTFSRRKYIQPPMGHILGSPVPIHPEPPASVSSLAGKRFTRRRVIQAPSAEYDIGFDGGIPPITSTRFDDKYLPFMRAKTII